MMAICTKCRGTGEVPAIGYTKKECPTCNGTAVAPVEAPIIQEKPVVVEELVHVTIGDIVEVTAPKRADKKPVAEKKKPVEKKAEKLDEAVLEDKEPAFVLAFEDEEETE